MAAYSACLPTLGPLEKLATDSESEVGSKWLSMARPRMAAKDA